jgi:putative endopeptidase
MPIQSDPVECAGPGDGRAGFVGGRARHLAAGVLVAAAVGVLTAHAQEPARPQGSAGPAPVAAQGAEAGGRGETAAPRRPVYGRWGYDSSAIQPAVSPGDSFYDYANGAWVARAVVGADSSRVGLRGALEGKTQGQIFAIILEALRSGAAPDTDTGRIGALYRAFMDASRTESLDLAPVAADLAAIRGAGTRTAVAALMGRAHHDLGSSLFRLGLGEDAKDPTRHALHVFQGSLGLPDRDYYLQDAFKDKKAAYRDYVARLLDMAAWPDAQQRAGDIVAFETRVAEASWSRIESRDRDTTYNPMTPAELAELAPDFPWGPWLEAAGLHDVGTVVVGQKSAFPGLAGIFAGTPVETLQAWMAFRLVDEAAPYLSARFVAARFDFRSRELAGLARNGPRWQRAVQFVNGSLGDAVGRRYVARYFAAESRARMEALVGEVKRALRARIENVAWMTQETKARALEKLDLISVKIGHPDRWRNYAALRIDPADLVGNVRRISAFNWAGTVARLDRPVDRQAWSTTPQTVNAFYRSAGNEIVLPAAILQPPFFDPNADMAINYGAIGGVIGHELTHAFDDRGRKSDGRGVLIDWWQPADDARFRVEAARLGAQYDTYQVAPGVNVKGGQTMGENIADLGGILLALDAYRASLRGKPAPILDGTTGEQRVFLGWAQMRRAKDRLDALKRQVVTDVHAPDRFRVDGPLRNVDAWYDAFKVKPGDKLYLKPEERVRIW